MRPLTVRLKPDTTSRSARRSRRPAPGRCSPPARPCVRMFELRRGLGRHRPDRRDDRRSQQVGGRLGAEHAHEVPDRRRAREGHDVDPPVEQHPVDVGFALALGIDDHGPVGDDLGDVGARRRSSSATTSRPMSARGSRTRRPRRRRASRRAPATTRFRAVLGRHEVDLQAAAAPAARPSPARRRTASRRAGARRSRGVASRRSMNASTALALANTIQSNCRIARARRRRADRSRRAARCGSSALRSPRRPAPRAARTSSAACSRGRVTRIRLPNSGRASNQRRCSRSAATRPTTRIAGAAIARLLDRLRDLVERPERRLLRRQRAVVDERRGVFRGPAVRHERAAASAAAAPVRRSRRSCRRAARGSSSRPTRASCPRPRARARRSACRRRPG